MRNKFIKLVAISIASSLLLVIVGFYINNYTKEKLSNKLVTDYAQQEKLASEQLASSLRSRVVNIKNSLIAMSLDENIQTGDTNRCNLALAQYIGKLDLGVGNIGRVGLDKKFRCSLNKVLIGTSATKIGNYLDPLFEKSDHPIVVSRQLDVPNVVGKVVAVHVPVYDKQNNFVGSLGGAIYLDKLAQEFFKDIKFAQTGFAGLHDDNGDIISTQVKEFLGKNIFSAEIQEKLGNNNIYTDSIRAAYKGTGSIFEYNFKGITRVAAVTPLELTPGHRWVVIVNVPKKEIVSTYIAGGLNSAFNSVFMIYLVTSFLITFFLAYIGILNYRFNKIKDDFLNLASHQLRTPLTAINWNSEILLTDKSIATSPKQQKYIKAINDSSKRMSELVGDLLDSSRLDLGKFDQTRELNNIRDLVKTVICDLEGEIKQKNINFSSNIQVASNKSFFDLKSYRMIFQNLLSNAVKYTPKGGTVRLKIDQTNKDSKIGSRIIRKNSYYIQVEDTGYGIPKNQQKMIFNKMFRATNVLTQEAGTGLGLYIVKEIIGKSKGTIWFQSVEGKGTTFHVILPIDNKGITG